MTETQQCPRCAAAGRDNHKDNLIVYGDGDYHCFACGLHASVGRKRASVRPENPSVVLPNGQDVGWVERKISLETMRRYRSYVDVGGNRLIFPFFEGSRTCGFTARDRTGRKLTTGGLSIFGAHLAKSFKGRTVHLCEGLSDTLTLAEVFPNDLVLGVPGASVYRLITRVLASLIGKEINVWPDSDQPGQQFAENLLTLIPKSETYLVPLPEKDVSACHVAGLDLRDLLGSRSLVPYESPYVTQAVAAPPELPCWPTGLPFIDGCMRGGIHPTEFMLLTGGTGSYKTWFALKIAAEVSKHTPVLYISTEMPLHDIKERMQLYEHDADRIFYNRSQALSLPTFQKTVRDATINFGVGLIVVDVLSDVGNYCTEWEVAANVAQTCQYLVSGQALDERGELYDCHPPVALLAVVHLKGDIADAKSYSQIRGGSYVPQKATSIFFLAKSLKDGVEGVTITPWKWPRLFYSSTSVSPFCVMGDSGIDNFATKEYDEDNDDSGEISQPAGADSWGGTKEAAGSFPVRALAVAVPQGGECDAVPAGGATGCDTQAEVSPLYAGLLSTEIPGDSGSQGSGAGLDTIHPIGETIPEVSVRALSSIKYGQDVADVGSMRQYEDSLPTIPAPPDERGVADQESEGVGDTSLPRVPWQA